MCGLLCGRGRALNQGNLPRAVAPLPGRWVWGAEGTPSHASLFKNWREGKGLRSPGGGAGGSVEPSEGDGSGGGLG